MEGVISGDFGKRWGAFISKVPPIYYVRHRPDRCVAKTKTKLNSVALVRERTMLTERPPLVGEVVPTFADRGCRMVSATDSHGR
jgi:hypothetical protein